MKQNDGEVWRRNSLALKKSSCRKHIKGGLLAFARIDRTGLAGRRQVRSEGFVVPKNWLENRPREGGWKL